MELHTLPRRLAAFALALTLAAAAVIAPACSEGGASRARGAVAARIAVGSAPAHALARAAVGDAVPLVAPLPGDADPMHTVPPREAIAMLRDARLVVLAGAGLEAFAATASLPPSRLVDAAAGTDARWIELPVTRHTHGGGEEHTHSGHDAHVWFDPDLLAHQVARIRDAATAAFPESRGPLDARRRATDEGIAAYRAELAALAPRVAGRRLLAAWPCYGYLARALGAEVAVAAFDPWAPDGGPSDAALRRLEEAAPDSAKLLLWPTPPPAALAERLARELGVTSVHVDALLRPRPEGDGHDADAIGRLRAGLAALAAALPPPAPPGGG